MPEQPPPSDLPRKTATDSARVAALRIAIIIAAVGGLWIIIFSQQVAMLALVGLLCAIIYILVYRHLTRAGRVISELQFSETRYRAIADIVADFAYRIKINPDCSAVMDWANEALSKITGYDQADLLGRGTLRDLIHPDDVASFDARLARIRRGEPYIGDFRIHTKTGDVRWIHDQARPVWTADHTRPEYIYGASQDITARRQAEEALRASEERLRRITDNMLDMVSQTDAAGTFQYVSPSHTTVLGYPIDQLVGHSVFEFVHPDDLNLAITAFQTGLANRTPGRAELRYRHADGHYVWIESIGNLLLADDGTPLGATFGSREITARRQYDEARTRHAHDLAALYDMTLTINAQPDMPTLLTTIINQALNLSGTSMGGIYLMQADGQTLELVANIPDTFKKMVLRSGEGLAGRVVQTGAALMVPDYSTWEGRIATFQTIKWGRVLAVPLRVRGKITGVLDVEDAEPGVFEESTVRVINLLADQAALAIDNRQLYDQTRHDLIERRRIEQQLRDSEARYRELVDNIGEGINISDDQETVVFANPATHDILGVAPDQLPGRNWREFTDAAAFEQILQQTALRRAGHVSTYELPVIRADGQRRTLLVTARPRFDQTGRYTGAFSVLRDITARVQAEAELARTRNDLTRRNEQLTQILEASNTIRSQLDLNQVLTEIAEAAYRSLGFRVVALSLIDPAANRVRICAIAGEDEVGRQQLAGAEYEWTMMRRLLQERFRRGHCYFVPQGEFDRERDFNGPYRAVIEAPIATAADHEAWQPDDALIVPIELRDGEIAGLLWPDGPVDGLRPTADTLRLLEIFAAQAAIALETARLFEAEHSRRQELEAVYQASRQLSQSLDLRKVLEAILRAVTNLVSATGTHLFLYEHEQLSFGAAFDEHGQPLAQPLGNPRPTGITYTAARSGEAIFVEDTVRHPQFNYSATFQPPQLAFAALPLKIEAAVIGVMNVGYNTLHHFEESEQRVLQLLAAQGAIAIQNARLHQQVQQHAVQLEQKVADRTAELDRQRRRLQTVLDAAGEGIQILDAAGRTEYFNPATERLTGYRAEEALGQVARFLVADSLTASPAAHDLHRAFQQGAAWQGELVSRRRDGKPFDVAITLTPLANPDGTLSGFVAIHRDVTRFRELDRLKDQFVSRIGHELRTPVANIKLYLELLQRSQPERHAQYLQTLYRETDRLRRLIDGFLEMAQLDAGAILIRPSAVDLNQLLGDAVEDRQAVADAHRLTLTVCPYLDLPRTQTDHTLAAQALSNLVDNALNYTPAGGRITLTTDRRSDDRGQWLTLSVSDSGPGIAPDERSRLHERFYRGEAARDFKVPGAGLGLSIVDAIMAQLGGRLTVESETGHGATFTLWLPVV